MVTELEKQTKCAAHRWHRFWFHGERQRTCVGCGAVEARYYYGGRGRWFHLYAYESARGRTYGTLEFDERVEGVLAGLRKKERYAAS